ncbi:dipeptide ABC transporter ATP-binding protein, partial [Anaerovorax odorimutans]|uniref:dipeptide ABC transporter ATP-binding protein n=1 Tax=Anaerovorax odorimutans TaxID=109327 RepID=UPI000417B4F4
MNQILKINNLTVSFQTQIGETQAVKGVSLYLNEGETLALVGESGCGKTVLCKTMLKLLCKRGRVKDGNALLNGKDLITMSDKEIMEIRGKDIAMIFQDPMTSLNPTVSIGKQIMEVMQIHENITKDEAKKRTLELIKTVGIDNAEKRFKQYPHHFSGGQRQRVAIAIALAASPKILLADEPTTALDLNTQDQIIKLIKDIQKKTNISVIFITHDLGLVEDMADRVAVMYDGKIIEEGIVSQIFQNPKEEYTKKLLGYLDYTKGRGHTHGKIHFHNGYEHAHEHSEKEKHAHSTGDITESSLYQDRNVKEKLVDIKNLKMYFELDKHNITKAVNDVSLEIYKGEILGLIGKSGCGKSTLARCIMEIYKPTAGEILYYGDNKQIIFQDSMSALNSRMTIEEIIAEPLRIKKIYKNKKELKDKVYSLMKQVELDVGLAERYPYDVSGGQRQRAAIARAISLDPDLIVADEPISSLDVSIQAQIVHLFKKLQKERNLTILFIAHDLPMVRHISDRILSMENGRLS